ncbi:MAG: protein kinase [Deltaproteobacteria bacterium]|nr:protein kinase [Deltaproteobacteria bacterium]
MSEVSPRVALEPGARLGAFVLEGQVAVGGMAEIWSAHRVTDGARRALKVLRPELSRDPAFHGMFEDEVRIATALSHRNIVAVFGVEEASGHLFQVLELVDGWDLRRVLSHLVRTGRQLPVPLALFVAREVAAGLAYAHTRTNDAGKPLNIVHRDVSPHNVMLAADGRVLVLDFGIARAAERTSRTRTGVIKGKLAYMAPEQALAVGVTPQTDIFALGVVLWEMLALERLFAGASDAEVVERVVKADVPPIRDLNPEVPDAVAQLLARMLAQRAPDRPATMLEVRAILDQVLADEVAGPKDGWDGAQGSPGEGALRAWLVRNGPDPRDDQDTRLPGSPRSTEDAADTGPNADPTVTMAVDQTWQDQIPELEGDDADGPEAVPTFALPAQDPTPVRQRDDVEVPPDVARTLVDADIGPSLARELAATPTPATPSARSPAEAFGATPTPRSPPAAQAFRRPTRDEIMRAVENQPTVEVEADPEARALGQALLQGRAAAPAVATVGRDAIDTVAFDLASAQRAERERSALEQHPTRLGPLVAEPLPRRADAAEPGSITPLSPRAAPSSQRSPSPRGGPAGPGADTPERGFRPIPIGGSGPHGAAAPSGAKPPLQPTELEQPAPSRSELSPAPSSQWILPVITLFLAGVVLVLIFMLIRGQ